MAAGKINLQANDTRIYEITAEDGAGSNVAITLPKEGGMLVVDAEVVHKTGDETIAGVKTFSSGIVVNGTTPILGKVSIIGDSGGVSLALSDNIHGSLYVKHSSPTTIGTDAGGGLAFATNGFEERLRIDSLGNVLVTGAGGLGYGTGSGGTVTQLTSKSTAVTLNKPCGQIIMHNASLAAGASAVFNLVCSSINFNDSVLVQLNNGALNMLYRVWVTAMSAGACSIAVKNETAGPLSEAIGINFAIIKGSIN